MPRTPLMLLEWFKGTQSVHKSLTHITTVLSLIDCVRVVGPGGSTSSRTMRARSRGSMIMEDLGDVDHGTFCPPCLPLIGSVYISIAMVEMRVGKCLRGWIYAPRTPFSTNVKRI